MIASTAPKPAAGPAPAAGAMLAGPAAGAGTGSFSVILQDVGQAEAAPGTAAAEAGVLADGMIFAIAGGNAGKAGGKKLPDQAASTADDISTQAAVDPAGVSLVLAGLLSLPVPPLPEAGPMTFDRPRAADPEPTPATSARQPASTQPVAPPAAPLLALAPVEIVAEQGAGAFAPLARQTATRDEVVTGMKDAAAVESPVASAAPPAVLAAPTASGHLPGTLPAPATGAAAPAASPSAPMAEKAQDFETLVSRLSEAREAASPHLVRTAIAHAEFGRISLQFRHEDNGLSVTMANGDPAFAGAVQAAAQASGAGNESDRSAPQQQGAPQHSAPGGGGQGQQPRAEQAGRARNRDAGTPSRSQDSETGEPSRRGGGIYA